MIIEWFNTNSGFLSLVFSCIVALSTVFYAVLTFRLVSETKKLRRAQTEPKVVVTIQPHRAWINIVTIRIENFGTGPAYDISFAFEPDMELGKHRRMSDFNFLKNGITIMYPGQVIEQFLTSMAEGFDKKRKVAIDLSLEYKNAGGKKLKDCFLLDFSQFIGMTQFGEEPIYDVTKSLSELQKNIQNLTTGSSKIKVELINSEDENASTPEEGNA